MGAFAADSVVLVPFPFSDLSQSKLRPAVALAAAGRRDWVLCQITSKPYGDPRALEITHADFQQGNLRLDSWVRPAKLFTAHESLFVIEIGQMKDGTLRRIVDQVISVIQSG